MKTHESESQITLNRTANLATAIGVILVGFSGIDAYSISLAEWKRILTSAQLGSFPAELLFRLLIPVAILALSQRIRRRAYGVYLAVGLLGVWELLRMAIILTMSAVLYRSRFTPLLAGFVVIFVAAHVALLAALVLARHAMSELADSTAVPAAQRRARQAVTGVVILLVVQAAAAVAALSFPGLYLRPYGFGSLSQVGRIPLAGVALVCSIAAVSLFQVVRTLRTHPRPAVLPLAWVAGLLSASLYPFIALGPFDALLRVALGWSLIELIHARRSSEAPASFGFEPIFAPPPTNAPALQRSDDAASA